MTSNGRRSGSLFVQSIVGAIALIVAELVLSKCGIPAWELFIEPVSWLLERILASFGMSVRDPSMVPILTGLGIFFGLNVLIAWGLALLARPWGKGAE